MKIQTLIRWVSRVIAMLFIIFLFVFSLDAFDTDANALQKIVVFLIQNIDRKLMLDDIANSKGLQFSELLSELEAIVFSGTKLDISHYVNEVMEEDKQQEIYEYFSEAESDSIEDALKELGEDDFSEEEVRLVRLRFISEMGN